MFPACTYNMELNKSFNKFLCYMLKFLYNIHFFCKSQNMQNIHFILRINSVHPDLLDPVQSILSMLLMQKVDFAAAVFSVTASRDTVIDFAQPYFRDESAVILKQPTADKLGLYLKPFSWQVCIIVCSNSDLKSFHNEN